MDDNKTPLGTTGNLPDDHCQCKTCNRLMRKVDVDAEGNCPDHPKQEKSPVEE